MIFFLNFRFTGGNESNMAVMEIVLPSGYTVDSDALPSLQLSHKVKRIETKEGDTTVVLYFDKVIFTSLNLLKLLLSVSEIFCW